MSVERGRRDPPCEGARGRGRRLAHTQQSRTHQAPHQSASPPQRRTTASTTITENATARAASTPSGKKTIRASAVRAQARARSTFSHHPSAPPPATYLELADRFPTAGRRAPANRAVSDLAPRPRCAARGPSRRPKFAGYAVAGRTRAQSAPPGARPGRRASAPRVARLGVEKRSCAAPRAAPQRRRARGGAGASRARPARRGRVCGRWRRARRRFRRVGASRAGSALKSG